LCASFVGYAIYTDTIHLSLNPNDNTCTLFVHGISVKGTYDKLGDDYTVYPSLGFMNCPIGPTMRLINNPKEPYVIDQTFGILKLKYVPTYRYGKGELPIIDPNGIIQFLPMKG